MINFETPGDEDEDDEDENDHFDRYQPSTIYNEFGNDPVLEARMGYVDENMREVGTGSARLADRESEVCMASSSTSMHRSRA